MSLLSCICSVHLWLSSQLACFLIHEFSAMVGEVICGKNRTIIMNSPFLLKSSVKLYQFFLYQNSNSCVNISFSFTDIYSFPYSHTLYARCNRQSIKPCVMHRIDTMVDGIGSACSLKVHSPRHNAWRATIAQSRNICGEMVVVMSEKAFCKMRHVHGALSDEQR